MGKEKQKILAQNYRGYGKGTEYAEVDTILPEKDLHTKGTINRAGKLEVWMTQSRPKDIGFDEWEKITQEKWNRIFKKGKR